jgi:hypothetical protein
METRLYFLFGDILSNTLLGAIVGALAAFCFSDRWPMLVAMVVGMFASMLLAAIFGALFGILYGAFELMVPLMLTAMVAGMALPMWATMEPLDPLQAAKLGAASGLVVLAGTYLLNAALRGKERQWTR